ncbi:MAG TPA: PP2C family protein-serine/threonine phosphatase [Candidatus Acidoferrales bacterium]|nr:PP2C family protein-serine/threonine phosphatase [Candidatus Acidoferrales bacterium]
MAMPETVVQPIPIDKVPGNIWEAEKDEARRIQESLLPTGPLRGPSFEVACRFAPFSEVSGDFADYFDLPNGLVGIYLGDVVGKGLPAAMYGAMVMGTLRGANKTGEDTNAVLATLNKRLLVRPVSGRFCATLYALFNPATLELKFSNAGLPFPLHASEAGCKTIGEGGLPSGLFPGSSYDVHSIKLSPGDTVLLATDGLHELRNGNDEDFSERKLSEVWHRCRGSSAKETLDLLFEGVKEFSAGGGTQHDDITVVVVKVMSTMVLPNPAGGFWRVPLR